MKRFLAGFAAFLASISLLLVANAQSTKSTLNTEVSTNIPDNTTGAITPAILRTTFNDFIASWQQATTVNAQTGTTYAFNVSDYGKLVTFSSASTVAATLAQATTTFATWNSYVKNIGTAAVVITPTVSTINGAATYTLPPSSSVFIVSDGANYQVFDGFRTQQFSSGTGSVLNPNTTAFIGNQGGFAGSALNALTLSKGGFLHNLFIRAGNAAGTGQGYTFTVLAGTYSPGSLTTTGITCTVTGASTTICNDSTNSSIVTSGTSFVVQVVSSVSAATLSGVTWALEVDN